MTDKRKSFIAGFFTGFILSLVLVLLMLIIAYYYLNKQNSLAFLNPFLTDGILNAPIRVSTVKMFSF